MSLCPRPTCCSLSGSTEKLVRISPNPEAQRLEAAIAATKLLRSEEAEYSHQCKSQFFLFNL